MIYIIYYINQIIIISNNNNDNNNNVTCCLGTHVSKVTTCERLSVDVKQNKPTKH